MIMKLLLSTNSPVANPGYIASKKTKKDYLTLLKEEPWYFKIFHFDLVNARRKYKLKNNYDLTINPMKNCIGGNNDLFTKIYPKSHTITKKTIGESGIDYDDDLFCGIFKNKKHFEFLLDSFETSDSEIVICNIDEVNNYLTDKSENLGIYFVKDEMIYTASNYSDDMWSYIKEGIIDVFGNLDAKKIYLKDKTNINTNINISFSKELIDIAPEIGLNLNRKCEYEIECEQNGTLNVSKAKMSINKLNMFKDLKVLALQMVDNPKHLKSIKQNVQLDISFGVNMKMLTLLQGSFEGGYSRKFDLYIEF